MRRRARAERTDRGGVIHKITGCRVLVPVFDFVSGVWCACECTGLGRCAWPHARRTALLTLPLSFLRLIYIYPLYTFTLDSRVSQRGSAAWSAGSQESCGVGDSGEWESAFF